MTFANPFFDVSRHVSRDVSRGVSGNVSHLFSIWDTSRPRRHVSGVPPLCAPFRAQRWDTGHMLDVSHPCVPIMRTHLRPIAMVPPWPKSAGTRAGTVTLGHRVFAGGPSVRFWWVCPHVDRSEYA